MVGGFEGSTENRHCCSIEVSLEGVREGGGEGGGEVGRQTPSGLGLTTVALPGDCSLS